MLHCHFMMSAWYSSQDQHGDVGVGDCWAPKRVTPGLTISALRRAPQRLLSNMTWIARVQTKFLPGGLSNMSFFIFCVLDCPLTSTAGHRSLAVVILPSALARDFPRQALQWQRSEAYLTIMLGFCLRMRRIVTSSGVIRNSRAAMASARAVVCQACVRYAQDICTSVLP
ncbi:uncharacterized protein LAESUDRAFT_459833 [Laetiporus sulphureus 93-53]|uniref:Uncharacterized protein n=1 Tax=Laetiporus sulphureus 93-53 TaxID=1314785 RepID=A0A165BRS1_9APHY|nr:uncharacterized protein LAESUDRAFT_459833 [Laetiporus sulphureus 93-53]KZT01534.1 hypothetical protein LAESUDRAFT_459833 [Laetiporus sulphureus 93-53]